MQSIPRPPASVPLGGSLRASRAALLARPLGPLAAVDLADGRALTVEHLGAGWVACTPRADAPVPAPAVAAAAGVALLAGPVRRRRLGTAVVLAGALGAAVVALAGGVSGAPAPAVAGPVVRLEVPRAAAVRPPVERARGGHAAASRRIPPARPPRPAATPAAPAVVAPPAAPPAPPPLPELPSVPAL